MSPSNRIGFGMFATSGLAVTLYLGGWSLPVITQLDTCRFKPPVRALRSLEMSSRASEMRFR